MSDVRLNSIKFPTLPNRYVVKDYDATIEELRQYIYSFFPQKSLPSAPIHAISDGADGIPIKAMEVAVRAVQDLHGQTSPYPSGGGKNKLGVTMTRLKTINNGGTWSGNTYTYNGVTFVCTATSDDYLESVTVSASNATANVLFTLMAKTDVASKLSALENTAIIGSGCPADGNTSTYYLNFQGFATDGIGAPDTGSGTGTINASSFTTFNTVQIYIRVASGATFSNKVFKPQLCLASASNPTTFAPYSNICPISGWSSASVVDNGINQWDEEWEQGNINNSGENAPSNTIIRSKNYIRISPSTEYYICGSGVKPYYYDEYKNFLNTAASKTNQTTTTPAGAYYMRFVQTGTSYGNNISINLPSTDTSYHAYNGNIVTIDFGGTVYGGTLKLVSGKEWRFTADRVYIELDSSYSKTIDMVTTGGSTQRFLFREALSVAADTSKTMDVLSNYFVGGNTADTPYAARVSVRSPFFDVSISFPAGTFTDVNDFKTNWLAGKTLQVVYFIATHRVVEIEADADTVTQYGDNVFYADCGDSTLTYRQDIGLVIGG